MLRLFSLVFLFAGFLICPGALFAQWEEVPSYEWREAMQIDSFQNRIFMLDDRGILYRSDNHGLRWKALQPGGSTLDEVEAFAGAGQVFLVYCASGDLWRSEDLGDTWALLIKTTPPLLNYTSSLVAVGGQFFLSNASAAYKLDAVSGQLTNVLSVPNSHINLVVTGNEIWATGFTGAPRMSPDLGQTWISYPNLNPVELGFQGDTVWVLQYYSNTHRIVYLLKSDPTQQLTEITLPADAVSNGWNRLSVAGGKLYYSYLGRTAVYDPANQSWQNSIPYWKNARLGKIWSDGSFQFALTTEGPARQNPATGTWSLCNSGILHLPNDPPLFMSTGRYLFMYDDFDQGGKGGVLLPGPSPVWVTPMRLFGASISQIDNGYYAWDDSSRFWRSDAQLREWTYVGTGPTLFSPEFYGRVFGSGDTLYACRSDARLLRSIDGGVNWIQYCGLPNESNWERLLLINGTQVFYIDEFKQVKYLNTEFNQGFWYNQGTVTGNGRWLDMLGSTLYTQSSGKSAYPETWGSPGRTGIWWINPAQKFQIRIQKFAKPGYS